jgi:hypothetical protein
MSRTTHCFILGLALSPLGCDPATSPDDGDARGSRACPSDMLPEECEGTSTDDGGGSSEDSTGHGETACGESEDDGTDDDGGSDDGDGEVDLPYDVKPQVGDVFKLSDAFLEEGPLPAAILEVEFDGGGDWRAAELQGDVAFEITQEDCDHEGNRDIGRDRVNITWQNDDGSEETDHLDIRYCEG